MRFLFALLLLCPMNARAERPVTVFAAASLTEALADVAALWQAEGHPAPVLSFAASSTLARQIEQGAPADIFASADAKWMDELDTRGLLAPGTRADVLANDLVLIVPADHARTVTLARGFDLPGLLAGGRLAVGDPAHVPAGLYGAQALKALGVWEAAEPHLARTEDVRGALQLVAHGEAPAGIVYATDAAVARGVAIAGIFPAATHDPIVYPFAVIRAGDGAEARALLDFLRGPAAQDAFRRRGFRTP